MLGKKILNELQKHILSHKMPSLIEICCWFVLAFVSIQPHSTFNASQINEWHLFLFSMLMLISNNSELKWLHILLGPVLLDMNSQRNQKKTKTSTGSYRKYCCWVTGTPSDEISHHLWASVCLFEGYIYPNCANLRHSAGYRHPCPIRSSSKFHL